MSSIVPFTGPTGISPHHRRYSIEGRVFEAQKPQPGLHVVATPIGHLGDVTLRALAILAGVDEILCEDTRVTSKLIQRYEIASKLTPYHDHNAAKLRPVILQKLAAGAALALVSDAGTPLVSDPGYKLVREAIASGFRVEAIPGASAAMTGLVLSGLPTDRFLFAGFLPEKSGERRRLLDEFKSLQATLVFFESGHRILASLADIAEHLGQRRLAVLREMTKLHEEGIRGTPHEVASVLSARETIKGEITLVIAPPLAEIPQPADIDAALIAAAKDLPKAKAAALVAQQFGVPRKDLYTRLLALERDDD
ncbi:16S rRNA (cytidine(1402)-2'-O)-methyltransferase [soil metagenome]